MSNTENKLVHNPIRPNCPADEIQLRVVGIVEDEVMQVKVTQTCATNASSELLPGQHYSHGGFRLSWAYRWYMVHVRFLHHGRHGLLHRPITKLIKGVLFPYLFKIKVGSIQMLLEKSDASRVCHSS